LNDSIGEAFAPEAPDERPLAAFRDFSLASLPGSRGEMM
jgi:hypothetical protein